MRRLVWLVVPAALGLYLYSKAPVVGLIDSGELATGCYLMNILHPTGYPLYTMLGRVASLVSLGSVFSRVAMLSALSAAGGVGLFLWLLLRMRLSPVASGATALLLAVSLPAWSVAVDVEVYALTILLAVLVLFTGEQAERGRRLLLFAYASGLAMTNHLSAGSVVLGVGLAVFMAGKRAVLRSLLALTALFLLGLTPYVLLLLRARASPMLCWGMPVNLERLWWHVTGKQYQVWMFQGSLREVLAGVARGAVLLCRSLAFVLTPIMGWGVFLLWRERRGLAIGLLVVVLVASGYAVNYSIPDIESYYLPALLALLVFTAVGADRLARSIGRWQHLLWLPALAMLFLNLPDTTRRGDCVAHDAALNTLASADSNAIIITDWWDLYAPLLYLQSVERVRLDVTVVDKELVRRSWYVEFLRRQFPHLAERSMPELEHYLPYLEQFEHDRLSDVDGIQRAFVELLRSFLTRSPERPCYSTYHADANVDAKEALRGFRMVPEGLLFRLRHDSAVPEFDYSRLRVRIPRRRIEARTRVSLERYSYFGSRRARLLRELGREAEAAAVERWWDRELGRLFAQGGRPR